MHKIQHWLKRGWGYGKIVATKHMLGRVGGQNKTEIMES